MKGPSPHRKYGLDSAGPQTRKAAIPPGLRTRRISDSAFWASTKYMMPRREVTRSNVSSANGSASASAQAKVMFVRPASRALSSQTSNISALTSRAVTSPFTPTSPAIAIAGSPLPAARSSTRIPGSILACASSACFMSSCWTTILGCHVRQALTAAGLLHSSNTIWRYAA